MWFSGIHVRAFGPMKDQCLEFAKGLNVVHGPNESGKSSWHAAITVGLSGLRRGAGRTKAEHEFEARHRPWDGGDDDPWFVRATVMLDNGNHIEIDRDLDNRKTDARRRDLGGRAFTDLPTNDGSPDGSMLLGLDRETFPMTASVRQASIVSDLDAPDALQQHLARAAAGGAGGTAAGALEKLDGHKRDHVGLDRKNSTKPLRVAKTKLSEAETNLGVVEQAHRKYLDLVSARLQHRVKVRSLMSQKARVEAQLDFCTAKLESDRLDAAIGKIDAWEKRFSAGDPSRVEVSELTELALALQYVKGLPQPEATHLPPVDELEAQQDDLAPSGSLPCPTLEEVQRCVAPLRGAGPAGVERSAVPTGSVIVGTVGLAFAILVGALVGIVYGIALAALAILATWAARSKGRYSTSGAHRESNEARAAALRQLGEWQLPEDPVAAVAEASRRIHALDALSRLEDDLRQRKAFDAKEAHRRQSHEDTWARLRSWALAQGVSGSDEDVRRRVQDAVHDNATARRQRDEAVKEWVRFQEALDERTPRQWRDEAATAREALDDARRRLADGGVERPDAAVGADQLRAEVDRIDRLIQDARGEAREAEGRLKQIDQESVDVDVAAAEARLSEAEAALEKVERLAATLNTASAFLEKAAENAHQLLAPRLGTEMTRWIPQITGGRYSEVQVDPGELNVTLVTAAGDRRDARLVSRGTTEQAYLVLRLVLAQVLSADHEACPVLLDDPTVHADANRKQEILDYLLAASKEHQVILFSQEQEVLDWAKNQVDGEVHLIELADPQPA